MGNFIWHEWSHFVSIGASVYLVWAGYWAIFFRKFFWDFVGGTLRDPGGIQPARSASLFVSVIVKAPVLQILVMLVAFGTLAIELPAPFIKGTAIHRSWVVRIVTLVSQSFLGLFLYQGTNGALYSLIAAGGYTMAQIKQEVFPEAKDNRGRGGKA